MDFSRASLTITAIDMVLLEYLIPELCQCLGVENGRSICFVNPSLCLIAQTHLRSNDTVIVIRWNIHEDGNGWQEPNRNGPR